MRPERTIRFRALAAVALAGAVSAVASVAAIAQPTPGSSHQTVIGTICRIDSGSGTLSLLTGVGHAFKLHVIHFTPGIQVKGRAAKAGLAAVAPGAVCKVECDVAGAGATAYSVEVLQPAVGRSQ